MAAKEISVKKYVVKLSGEERERLGTLIRKGKSPARWVLKARILLKADVSEAGKGWSDNRIIEALETNPSMIYRARKQLVEEGFKAVLSRKPRAMPAIARLFDGEKEATLIALACSKPPKGRARWTLRLLENKVIELGFVDRASDSTIGRALKKTLIKSCSLLSRRSLRSSSSSGENHDFRFEGIAKTNLQGNRYTSSKNRQIRLLHRSQSAIHLNGLEILHGRQFLQRKMTINRNEVVTTHVSVWAKAYL